MRVRGRRARGAGRPASVTWVANRAGAHRVRPVERADAAVQRRRHARLRRRSVPGRRRAHRRRRARRASRCGCRSATTASRSYLRQLVDARNAGKPLAVPALTEPARPGRLRRTVLVSDQPALVRMAAGLDFLLDVPVRLHRAAAVSRARAEVALKRFRTLLAAARRRRGATGPVAGHARRGCPRWSTATASSPTGRAAAATSR